jgi:hypothetical protein
LEVTDNIREDSTNLIDSLKIHTNKDTNVIYSCASLIF